MARETAYTEEERRRMQDEERGRREMPGRHTEREYEGLGQEEYRYRRRQRPDWMSPGPYSGVGPRGYERNDETIKEDVCERLMEHGQLDARNITVEVQRGLVTLQGFVNNRSEKRAAEDAADSVPGVNDVRNELRVGGREMQGERERPAGYWESGRQEREREGEQGRYEPRRESERRESQVGSANLSVFAIYRNRESVEEAVDALKSAGFRNTDISVLFPDNKGTKDFAFEKGTKAPEGVVAGAGSGAVVGGVLGWLAGIGVLAVPGIGPFIAAGPIVAALAGMGIAGTIGGIAGALIGMGIPEYEAKRYEGRVKGGHVLLSVHSDDRDWAKRAENILERTGGEDVARAGEKSADFAETDKPLPRGSEYR